MRDTDDAPPPAPRPRSRGPAPAAPGSARARMEERAKARRHVPFAVWALGGAVVLVGVGFFLYLQTDRKVKHAFPIDWPVATATGEPVAVSRALAIGEAFETTLTSEAGIVMGEDHDPMQGMKLKTTVGWTHVVEPAEGSASRSRIVVRLDGVDGLPLLIMFVKTGLVTDKPLEYELLRDSRGLPVAGSGRVVPGRESQRPSLDYCVSGLSDLTSCYLPPHDVRLGEVWDLKDAMALGDLVEMMRYLTTLNKNPQGFPAGGWEGKVGAEALEARDGEPCVRLKLALEARMEGDVVSPAEPGWISAVAKVEGKAWVSTKSGILWGLSATSEGRSTYDTGRKKEVRKIRQLLSATTKRTT